MKIQLFPQCRLVWRGWLALCLCVNGALATGQSPEEMAARDMAAQEMAGQQASEGFGQASGSSPKPQVALTETGPSPYVLWQMSQPDFSALGDEFARLVEPSTVAPAPIETGPKLRNEAHVAFRYGNLGLARELFFGHLALGGEAASSDLETVQFSNQFRRPAWHVRWGIAIGITGDDSEIDDFDPITAETTPGAFNGMGGMSGGPDTGEMFDDSGMDDFDMDNSGMDELGMDELGMGGMMGMDGESGFGGPRLGGPGAGRGRQTAEIQVPEAQTLDPAVSERLQGLTGMVADKLNEGLSSRVSSGRFGSALTDVAEEDTTQGFTVGGETVSRTDRPMWIPGVVFMGEGPTREMTELAAREGIELLVYVIVSVKKSRTDQVQNICRAKIVDCKTGKTLVASGGMDNREVKRLLATKRGTADGYVTDQLETFWKIIDSRLALTALPKLSPAIAMKRVTQLMSDASHSKVRKLAEVRLFHQKGWLTDEELEKAFEIIAGADGIKILYAPLSESIPLIRELVRLSSIQQEE